MTLQKPTPGVTTPKPQRSVDGLRSTIPKTIVLFTRVLFISCNLNESSPRSRRQQSFRNVAQLSFTVVDSLDQKSRRAGLRCGGRQASELGLYFGFALTSSRQQTNCPNNRLRRSVG